MTKEEVLAKLKELGLDVNGATEEVIQKAQAWLEALHDRVTPCTRFYR